MKKYLVVGLLVASIMAIGIAADLKVSEIAKPTGIVISTTKPYKVVRNINPNEYSKKYWVDVSKVQDFPDCDGEYIDYAFGLYYEVDDQERSKRDAEKVAKEKAYNIAYNKDIFFNQVIPKCFWTLSPIGITKTWISYAVQAQYDTWLDEGYINSARDTVVDWSEYFSRQPTISGDLPN